jgi:hypothetical protein
VLFEWLFGWILELLPFDMSVVRRGRLYRKGRRVYFRARVSGLSGASFIGFLAAERGALWLAPRRGATNGELVPIPLPRDPKTVSYSDKPTWNQDRYVSYQVAGKTVTIFCKYDWDLLLQALTDGMTPHRGPQEGAF